MSGTSVARERKCGNLYTVLSTIRVLAHNGPVLVELARWRGRLVVTKRVLGAPGSLSDRLAREAEVVSRLKHDNIVPLLGVEDGVLIFAYCPGVSLAELLEDGPMSLQRVTAVMDGVFSALLFAHRHGVLHLDVKPGNILLRGAQVLLTDFGFAKDLALSAITSEHALLGTPGYMAPEQFRGVRNDRRSDLYAAGAVLWHMLAGEPPYGRNALRFLAGDKSIALGSLPPAAAGFRPLLEHALAFDPEDRFQSVADFQAALAESRLPELA